jgi:hypothetical protein
MPLTLFLFYSLMATTTTVAARDEKLSKSQAQLIDAENTQFLPSFLYR